MTFTLTTSQHEFIHRMAESEEHERKGYELILKKEFFAELFDALSEAGYFSPEHNPGPRPAKEEGYVNIPYWPALDYLEACARLSGSMDAPNPVLANKVLAVVRSVSSFVEADGKPRRNYHTYRKFAEILGLVPTATLTYQDIDLLPNWLSDPYEHGLVCHALDKGAMVHLLGSTKQEDWPKALRIFYHCTALDSSATTDEPRTIVEDHWLNELIQHHASGLAQKLGHATAKILQGRLQEVFGSDTRSRLSYLFRPAVEQHQQNHPWHGPENRFVEGLRDVLLSWVAIDPSNANRYISLLLTNELQMARRVAIYVIDKKWEVLSGVFINAVSTNLFDSAHLHELYNLLAHHFGEMENPLRSKILAVIADLPVPDKVEDKVTYLNSVQRNWLSALIGKGSEEADNRFAALTADLGTQTSSHPDFLSYMESSWGHRSSVYPVNTLLAFAKDSSLIEKLNGFQEIDPWKGPTIHALVDALTEAVALDPNEFIAILPQFLLASRPYQYGVIAGIKRAWDKTDANQAIVNWDAAWAGIMKFITQLLAADEFWMDENVNKGDWSPNRDWIPPIVADLLHSGTRDDNHAYPDDLLLQAKFILELMLEKLEPAGLSENDAMSIAINSAKGKVIEAWFSYSLRVCRLEDKNNGNHVQAWKDVEPIFERELAKCVDGNYEFSTLAACYLANFEYMNFEWLEANIKRLFPFECPDNFNAAIVGLAYSQPTKTCYLLLVNSSVIDEGLRNYKGKREFKERLVERVALAYLWGNETLESPRFRYWFDEPDLEALKMVSHYFWSISNQELEVAQKEGIKKFWTRCIEWSSSLLPPPGSLLSSLCLLVPYFQEIGEAEKKLLMTITPYAHINYNADRFIEYLDRMAEANPEMVYEVLNELLKEFKPIFDFEDHLKSIMKKLAGGGMREKVLVLVDSLRMIQGMPELFLEIEHM